MNCSYTKPIFPRWLPVFFILLVGHTMMSPAYSCACCGIDNSWSSIKLNMNNDYEKNVISKLNFVTGKFYNHDQDINITKVSLKNNQLHFKTKKGIFVFTINPTFMHHSTDITFITNVKNKLDNVADIYRTFVFTGTLTYPARIAKEFSTRKINTQEIKARLIFQGLGNSCVQTSDFKKWLIKPVNSTIDYLHGTGSFRVSP